VYSHKSFQSAPSNQAGAAHFARIYLILSFLIAWLFWLLAWLDTKHYAIPIPLITLVIIGSFGPFVGAGVSTLLEGGLHETLRFYARALNPHMGWVVFLLSFFLMPIMSMGAELLHSRLMHVPFVVNITWAGLPMTYVFLFLLRGELSRRSTAGPNLSDKLDALLPLTASVFTLGTIWALWHLPLFFIIAPGLVQAYTLS
jgi:hypothetical protein